MVSFDVTKEGWIPVAFSDGGYSEVGLLELFQKAHLIKEISEPSPVIKYSIFRILVAFLTDALRPEMIEDLVEILEAESFNMSKITRYVEACEKDGKCFDLFDSKKPFLQTAFDEKYDDEKKTTSVAKLVHDLPSGNNAIHFNHTKQDEHAFSPAVCTRILCAVSVFCTSGLQGPSGINGAPPWYLTLEDDNLFKTLVKNLYICGADQEIDNPPIVWRSQSKIVVEPEKKMKAISYLYGLTLPARRVLLIPSEGGLCTYTGRQISVLVKNIYLKAGLNFEGYDYWKDPFVPYRLDKKKGRNSIKPREGRAPWRDFNAFALGVYEKNNSEVQYDSPAIVRQYIDMVKDGGMEDFIRLNIYGLVTDQANYVSWLEDSFKLDTKIYIGEGDGKTELLQSALEKAEGVSRAIKYALKQITKKDDYVGIQAETKFFSEIRNLFFTDLIQMAGQADTRKYEWRLEIWDYWNKVLKKTAKRIFNEVADQIGNSSQIIGRRFKAEGGLDYAIYLIIEDIKKGAKNERTRKKEE